MTDEDTARLVRRLADIEAIRQLKHRYCGLCDDGYDADPLAERRQDLDVLGRGPRHERSVAA